MKFPKILELLIRLLKALKPKRKKKKVRFSSETDSNSSIDEHLEKINKSHELYYGERGTIPIKISKC